MNRKRLFFLLTIFGVAIPIVLMNTMWHETGGDKSAMIELVREFLRTGVGRAIALTLFVSGVSLTILAIDEAVVRHDYYLLWVIPVLLVFGIGAALPFYLYIRTPRGI